MAFLEQRRKFLSVFERSFALELSGRNLPKKYKDLYEFHPTRLLALGTHYEQGIGFKKNIKKAVRCYLLCGLLGDRRGWSALGVIYYYGTGVRKDESLGLYLIERNYKAATATTAYNIGALLFYRKESKFKKISIWCLRSAANRGEFDAHYYLAISYDFGTNGLRKNKARAIFHYLKAAKGGHVTAQFNLGKSYEIGDGTRRNLIKAAYWYGLAAKQGDSDARKRLKAIKVSTSAQGSR